MPSSRLPTVVPTGVAIIWLVSALAILFDAGPLQTVAGGVAAALGLASVVRSGGMIRVFALTLGAASVALIALDADPRAALIGLERAGRFCAFLAGLYALRGAVESNPTLNTVRARLRNLPRETRRGVLLWLGWLFSVPLAIGALSVIAPLVAQDADTDERVEAATWGVRGMALTVLFSPFTVAMGLVTSLGPRVPFPAILSVGLALSLTALLAPLATRSCRSPLAAERAVWIEVGRVLAPVLVLIALILAASGWFGWSVLEASIVLVAPFAAGTVGVTGSRARRSAALRATRISWGRFDNEVAILTSALVFAALATDSRAVVETIDHAAHLAGPGVLVLASMATICLLSMIGVHMVVPAVVTLSVLGPLMPDSISALLLCLGVLIGWSFGAMTGLGSISFLVATKIFRVPPRRTAFGPNLRFMIGLCLAYALAVLVLM